MPFAAPTQFDDPNDPNKKNQEGGVNISGQSTSFATNVPGQDASSKNQKSSGQYTNIQSYLDANKDQADQMGQKISTDVGQKADDATQKINSFESKAPKVQAYDPNAVLGRATSLSDDEKNQYKTMKQTGGYTGPQSVDQMDGYQDTQKSYQAASEGVKNAGSESGQQQLLKQTYARPQYSAGENKLDQVLLQNSAGSKSALEGLTQKYAGLDGLFNNTTQKVGEAVNQANSQALANKQAFIPAEQNALKGLMDPIQQRVQQTQAENPALIKRITDDASDETLSDETLKTLGLNAGQNLYDLNLQSYINPDQSQIGVNNVATADERQKYAALASLFGDQSMNQITADGKAVNPVSFDKSKFDKDLASKQTEYQNAQKSINDQMNQSWQEALNGQSLQGVSGQQLYDNLVNNRYRAADQQTQFNAMQILKGLNQRQAEIEAQRQAQLAAADQTFKTNRQIKKG